MKAFWKIFLAVALASCAPSRLFACAACYGGNIDSPMTDAMNWGILTLLGVIGTVLAAFLTFLIYAIRKSEALADTAENSQNPTQV